MQRHVASAVLMVGILTTVCSPASGQDVADLDDQLIRQADAIVVGTVTDLRSQWHSDRTRIITLVTVRVDEVLKGDQNHRSLVVSVPGGEVDGVGELYTHTARFTANENVVLFVERESSGILRVAGGEHGKFTIARDRLTGRKVVRENQLLEAFTTRIKAAVQHRQND